MNFLRRRYEYLEEEVTRLRRDNSRLLADLEKTKNVQFTIIQEWRHRIATCIQTAEIPSGTMMTSLAHVFCK